MKIIVFSDSHGERRRMSALVGREKPGMIVHLGDHIADFRALAAEFPQIEACGVRGNCDLGAGGPERLLVSAEGREILLVHGHQYNVKLGYERFFFAAMEAGADIALFGHTHIPFLSEVRGMTVMNPGSVGRGAPATFGLIEIDGGGVHAKILPADRAE
jgi:putative phosphoesterase